MNSDKGVTQSVLNISSFCYVVYDSDITNQASSREVAFIEQRSTPDDQPILVGSDEKYFASLSEAKRFVKCNFISGAEYFSYNQINDPDNFLYYLTDKLAYLMA